MRHSSWTRSTRHNLARQALVVTATLGLTVATIAVAQAGRGPGRPTMPRSAEVETATGARIERATLAADGGLLDIRYVVLDPTRAGRWLGDTTTYKPPKLVDQRNSAVIDQAAPMHESHEQRAGQTYYVIYHNTHGAVHRGDLIDITVAGVTLRGVPVE